MSQAPGRYNAPQKRVSPFRMGETPFDPRTGKHLPFWPDDVIVRELTITGEAEEGDNADDCLVCEDEDGKTVYVAKPYTLQRTPFDEQVIDDKVYIYSTPHARTIDDLSGDIESQEIDSPYVFDGTEKIMAAAVLQYHLKVGPRKVKWVDLNTAGRQWLDPTDKLPPYPGEGVYWLKLTVAAEDAAGEGTLSWGETTEDCP